MSDPHRDPLAGEGASAAGGFSLGSTGPAGDAGDAGRAAFSKERFACIARVVFARGGRWKDVARFAGLAPNKARVYGARLLIRSPHPPGRPAS